MSENCRISVKGVKGKVLAQVILGYEDGRIVPIAYFTLDLDLEKFWIPISSPLLSSYRGMPLFGNIPAKGMIDFQKVGTNGSNTIYDLKFHYIGSGNLYGGLDKFGFKFKDRVCWVLKS